jgi:allophanate hydrolase
VVGDLLARNPGALLPVTHGIISRGADYTARDAFAAQYRLAELRGAAETAWAGADVLLLPTLPCLPTLAQVGADPVGVNSRLGTYTNFVNLLDLCGIAVPVAGALPFGVTLLAPAWHERPLAALAARFLGEEPIHTHPSARRTTHLVVCGAHMRGLPLNGQLTALGGRFVREAATAPVYRMLALPPASGLPARPGLVRADDGASLPVEVWALPVDRLGELLLQVKPPLGLGTALLADGETCPGFICEAVTNGATDITAHGGWRNWLRRE